MGNDITEGSERANSGHAGEKGGGSENEISNETSNVAPKKASDNENSPNSRIFTPKGASDNVVFVGGKPLVNYIRAVSTQFSKWKAKEVTIKSRGKFISKAVDVAEVARRSIDDKKVSIKSISVASESFESDGKKTNISTMDIVLFVE